MSDAVWDYHGNHINTHESVNDPLGILKELKNTYPDKDEVLRLRLRGNVNHVLVATLEEVMKVVHYYWKKTQQSIWYNVISTYGLVAGDLFDFSKLVKAFGRINVRCEFYTNQNGTQLVKFFGRPGCRAILQAPVWGAKHFKVINAVVGVTGVVKRAVNGTVVAFVVSPLIRTVEFLLTEEKSFSRYQAEILTDWAKLAIVSGGSLGLSCLAVGAGYALAPFAALIFVGVGGMVILNALDDYYKVTDRLTEYLEGKRQQAAGYAAVATSSETFACHDSEWGVDLYKMKQDGLLASGRAFTLGELEKYRCASSHELTTEELSWEEYLITP